MKQLTSAKSEFLLEAPLEVLHEESMEWMEEIEFWKDEAAFFYSLIIEKTKLNPSVFNTKEAKDFERHLIYISSEKLDDLKMEVEEHEKFLSRLMDNYSTDQQLYRSRHKIITEKFNTFKTEFNEMKRKIFLTVEKADLTMKSHSKV